MCKGVNSITFFLNRHHHHHPGDVDHMPSLSLRKNALLFEESEEEIVAREMRLMVGRQAAVRGAAALTAAGAGAAVAASGKGEGVGSREGPIGGNSMTSLLTDDFSLSETSSQLLPRSKRGNRDILGATHFRTRKIFFFTCGYLCTRNGVIYVHVCFFVCFSQVKLSILMRIFYSNAKTTLTPGSDPRKEMHLIPSSH